MSLTLPVDFPTHLAFYKIPILREVTDNPENLQFTFHIHKFRLMSKGQQSFGSETKIVSIGQLNGTLWLNTRIVDMDFYKKLKKGTTSQIIANFSVSVRAKKREDTVSKQMNVNLKFEGLLASFCDPSPLACFSGATVTYNISEGSVLGETFDFLQNLGFPSLCPNRSIEYDLISDDDVIQINRSSGTLFLLRAPDFEETHFTTFNVTCRMEDAFFSMVGIVNVLDINDNAPTPQNQNTSTNLTLILKSWERTLNFPVSVVDKDSRRVNNLVVRIEDDSLNLFVVKRRLKYGILNNGKNTFLRAEIGSDNVSFPGNEYKFTVVFEDKTTLQENKTVIYSITIIKEIELELDLKDRYEFKIFSNVAAYARLIELNGDLLNYKFHLDIGVKDYDWLGVTERSGIVYVKDPELMPHSSTVLRNVIWTFNNTSGSILLSLTIQDESSKPCALYTYCSYNKNETSCLETCGNGSPRGFCEWRSGSLTPTAPNGEFATCSPDLSVCPDGRCDELEEVEPTLCPQDCAKIFSGETNGPKALGSCSCPSVDRCRCTRLYQPAQMIQHKSESRSEVSTLLPIIEILNETEEETSTVAPLPGFLFDGSCGPGCILFACIVPAGLLLVLVVLVVTRRMRIARINKHKFVSSHISLSGVPSDYVEERSNSAQGSRHTPSETSSFGKAFIDAKWEFPRNRLQILSPLGEGEFGQVMKAQAWNIAGVKGYTTVAVKMLKENGGVQEKQDLITEFLLLKEISHPNIVRLLGASTEKNGQFYLIVEFAEMGSLRAYLRKRRRHNNCCKYNATYGIELPGPVEGGFRDYYQFPCERARREPNHNYFHKEQLSFAWQIAKGMAYLSDMKLVHRDLATRNILLAKHKVVKISDFGLSRDIYEGDAYLKRTKGRVPVKWMAIESLEDQIYTSRSDVWSFGVVLWEIMMLGATPYPGITPQRLYNLLKAGYRMTKPENCSNEMYYLMRQCWRSIPHERPSFKELVLKLDWMLQDTVAYMDFSTKGATSRRRSRELIAPPNGLVPVLQYTSVLVEHDEEEPSDADSNENIGLARLFSQSPKINATYTNSRESA